MRSVREQELTVDASPPVHAVEPATGTAVTREVALGRFGNRVAARITPHVARQLQVLGRTGVGGMALLVAALTFFAGANLQLRNEIGELRTSLETTQQGHSRAPGDRTPAVAMRSFLGGLPERSALPAITGKIVAEATAAGIVLERGNYDFTVTHSGRLVRARMTFPVHGRYTDIRRFIDATLVSVPDAAVDGLRLERKDIGAGEVDADIRFAIYLRGGP